MNLQKLHPFVEKEIKSIKPKIHKVFDKIMKHRLATGGAMESRGVNTKTLFGALNRELKKNAIKVIGNIDPKSANTINNCPLVGGWCYWENEDKTPRIEVLVHVSAKGRLHLTGEEWDHFRYKILETTLHELVHRAQYTLGFHRTGSLSFRPNAAGRLDPKLLSEQQYMGSIDEIEAYARDTVEIWHYIKPELQLTMRNLKKEFVFETNIHALQWYYDAYDGDIKHPAILRFFRKVIEWSKLVTPLANELQPCPANVKYFRRLYGQNAQY